MPKCIILVGIPTSGKDFYIKKHNLKEKYKILCCDDIRTYKYGKDYKHSKEKEDEVWKYFYNSIENCVLYKRNIVINNTNCKGKYIKNILDKLDNSYEIVYIWFDISLIKAYFRNIKRYLQTGKYIPIKVINSMYKNYLNTKEIWKE